MEKSMESRRGDRRLQKEKAADEEGEEIFKVLLLAKTCALDKPWLLLPLQR